MIQMNPPKVYVHKSVYDSELTRERFHRMMKNIQADEVNIVDDAGLEEAVNANNWLEMASKRTGAIERQSDPILIFNTFRFLPEEGFRALSQQYPALSAYHFLGNGHWTYRDSGSLKGGMCKSAYEIHSAWGCYHACDYCHVKNFLNIMLNLEEFVERLDKLVKRESWQKLYKYDNQTDTICLEPEYGASELLVNYFAGQDDKYLMLYTKSDNVDHLLDLDHNGHTIINWTVSCDTVAREIEKKAPTMKERIQAAARCQEAGYTVRFRFSPIVPIKDWQAENRQMIEVVFEHVRPDLITMDVLGWMSAEQIKDSMELSLFDDEYRDLVEDMAQDGIRRVSDSVKQIFPHPARLRIYRFFIEEIRRVRGETPIAICMETEEMWRELSDELGMQRDDYVCCCGPVSVPGHPMLT
ncbi:radical SAM protein [Candidatus Poribacteria bacterium]